MILAPCISSILKICHVLFHKVEGTFGPMAPDMDSIVLAMRALWDGTMHELDPCTTPLKFNEEQFQSKRKLRIGYYYDCGKTPACYTAHRAVNLAKDHLRQCGHEVKF